MANDTPIQVDVYDRGEIISFHVRGLNYSWIMWSDRGAYGGVEGIATDYSLRKIMDAIAMLRQ